MTRTEALDKIAKMKASNITRADVKERLRVAEKSVREWNYIPVCEIDLLESILFVAGVDHDDATEE